MRPESRRRARGLAYIGSAPTNPYLRLLYDHLEARGFEVERCRPTVSWLIAARRRVGILHLHWPEGIYRASRGPRPLRGLLSWINLVRFAVLLTTARALGFRIVWTVHQMLPHERCYGPLDRCAVRLLVAAANLLLVHDDETRRQLESSFPIRAPIRKIRHGSYVGAYPAGRSRAEMRDALGLDDRTVAFLAFGEIRAYKGLDLLLEAFTRATDARAALIVAGHPREPEVAKSLQAAARSDPRILLRLELIPERHVAELYQAADVAVIARSDGGTSGALILAFSMGKPVVTARAYEELVGTAGWFFEPADVESLAETLHNAAGDRAALVTKQHAATTIAEGLAWPPIADELTVLLDQLSVDPRITKARPSPETVS